MSIHTSTHQFMTSSYSSLPVCLSCLPVCLCVEVIQGSPRVKKTKIFLVAKVGCFIYWEGVVDCLMVAKTEINPQGPLHVKGFRAVFRWVPVWEGANGNLSVGVSGFSVVFFLFPSSFCLCCKFLSVNCHCLFQKRLISYLILS